MSTISTPFLLMFLSVALVAMALLMLNAEARKRVFDARVEKAVGDQDRPTRITSFIRWISDVGMRFRYFYSPSSLDQLRGMVQASGYNPHRVLPILIGSKLVLILTGFIVAGVAASVADSTITKIILLIIGVATGMLVPDLILKVARRRFNKAIQRSTPEAIDLLIVCSEAGMGLESALARVSQEMKRSTPEMGRTLDGLLDDLRILPNRQDAFANLSARSSYDGLRRFGTMLNQSLQYGTSLSDALRAIADELRRDAMNKLEERATKLGAKLLFPMVAFMLPVVIIVAAGGSFMHIIDTFAAME